MGQRTRARGRRLCTRGVLYPTRLATPRCARAPPGRRAHFMRLSPAVLVARGSRRTAVGTRAVWAVPQSEAPRGTSPRLVESDHNNEARAQVP